MGYAWPTPPAFSTAHAPGTRVAKPRDGWCWATVSETYGTRLAHPRACSHRAQPGRCTCRAHRAREREAQALKASLAGQESTNT